MALHVQQLHSFYRNGLYFDPPLKNIKMLLRIVFVVVCVYTSWYLFMVAKLFTKLSAARPVAVNGLQRQAPFLRLPV
jgi:hypothetical protein